MPDGIVYDEFLLLERQATEAGHRLVFAAVGRVAPLAADTDMFGFPLTSRNHDGSEVRGTLEMTLRSATESVGGDEKKGG